MYLPETVLAHISALHFAGTTLSRDYLLECMELACSISDGTSNVGQTFLKCNRMDELIEAFASCSKALAVISSETRSTQPNTRKIRETGWSLDIWVMKEE